MGDNTALPITSGLAVGIALLVLFGVFFNDQLQLYPKSRAFSQESLQWIKITKELDDVKAFLNNYPTAKTTTYSNTRIVDYFVYDSISSKFANLRLQIGLENSVTFTQILCGTVDIESREVTNEESVKESHGQHISNVEEFLVDEKCPHATGNLSDSNSN